MKPEAHVPVAAYAHEHPVLQNPGETRTLDHLPQLDGLRAVAVGMVLWSHFIPKSAYVRGGPPWGAIGVGLFFVLSGFLITRILLNCRLKVADRDISRWWGLALIGPIYLFWRFFDPAVWPIAAIRSVGWPSRIVTWIFFAVTAALAVRILVNVARNVYEHAGSLFALLKQFYVRRFLRIFPLYYGTLAVLLVLNVGSFRERAWYSVLYLTNYRFSYDRPAWLERWGWDQIQSVTGYAIKYTWNGNSGPEAHLWSLSVEEQFYIVWPFLILLVPRALMLPGIVLTVLAGPVWRSYTYEIGYQKHEWMTPGCLDLLAMGGLLALLSLPKFGLAKWRDGFVQLCGLVGIPMAIAYLAQRWYATVFWPQVKVPTAVGFDWLEYGGAVYVFTALVGVWLIGTAARGFRGPIGWFLTWAPVVYVGRVSYGIYVLHLFAPHLLGHYFPGTFGRGVDRVFWHTLLFTAIAVAAASVSWFCYEAPLNKLKRYFEYDKRAAAKSATEAAAA